MMYQVERNLTGYQQFDFSTLTHMRKFQLTIHSSKGTCYRMQVVVNEANLVSHFTVDLFSTIFFFHCCLPVFIFLFLFISMYGIIRWYKFLILPYWKSIEIILSITELKIGKLGITNLLSSIVLATLEDEKKASQKTLFWKQISLSHIWDEL